MRILELDVERIAFSPVKIEAEAHDEAETKEVDVSEALVVLVSVEKGDDESAADSAMNDIGNLMDRLKRKKLVLYPYAHLSSNLSGPEEARRIIGYMYEKISQRYETVKAPFGWNKKLMLDIKGHPLAEQARSFSPVREEAHGNDEESHALEEEDKVVSTWYILDEEGKLWPYSEFDFSKSPNLKKFADYEIRKVRTYATEPPHIAHMKRLQLVGYEPGSDSGNFRYYPNGKLIKSLLESYVTSRVIGYGAVEVETPIMYDYAHPALKEYLHRFPARHYVLKSDDKEYFLRFSADFGQFLMAHDATISYRHLPFKFYELTRYSFRREKSGELAGLKRLRAFSMPDMHTLCENLDQAMSEFGNQFRFCVDVLQGIGIGIDKYEAAFRFTEDFWKGNSGFIKGIISKELKKPALIEMWNFRYAYFDPKFEFNIIDSADKATALATVQIDHENGKRYGMSYVDSSGSKKYPIVLHCSPSGAIERVIYALLELASIEEAEHRIPELPLWLSPTQIRILPLSDKFIQKATEIAGSFARNGIRADVDDTDNTLNKKVMNAEKEWVPYICVVGEKEISSGKLAVRIRSEKEKKGLSMTVENLSNRINELTLGMPKAPLTLNMLLSKRPYFS